MENLNFHKQKLYSLIIAGVAFISLLLPWLSFDFGILGGGSVNGFRSWGYLTLIGVVGVVVACFIGDKSQELDETFKKVALGSFAAIVLGALIFFLKINDALGLANSGFGLWLAILSGLAGLALLLGFIKIAGNKKPPLPPQP